MRLHFEETYPFWRFPAKGGTVLYPMVPVELIALTGKSVATFALLDSGADVSLFHAKWAMRIGLHLTAGQRNDIGGIKQNQALKTYFHPMFLKVGSNRVACDVGFSADLGEEMTDQLVGRAVVFDRMRFALRQHMERVYIGYVP